MGFKRAAAFIFLLLAFAWLIGCSGETASRDAETPLASNAVLSATTALPTPTLHPEITPPPPPTPPITPSPNPALNAADLRSLATVEPQSVDEYLQAAQTAVGHGDYDTAVSNLYAALDQSDTITPAQQIEALYILGTAHFRDGRAGDAATILNQLTSLEESEIPSEAYFLLGAANTVLAEYSAALTAYEQYLTNNPEMAAYVYPRIADIYLALDDQEAAIKAFEAALEGPAHRIVEVNIRQQLAAYALTDGNIEGAVAQYDAIYNAAQTDATKGLATYLAGIAYLQNEDTAAAYERFQYGVDNYPDVYETYAGLVELVKAEVPVDEYQRGLVDYEAAAFQPAIEAFERLITADEFPADAYLYLAWSHEALGELEAAREAIDSYAELEPEMGLLERAKLLGRSGDSETAVSAYLEFADTYLESDEVPFALWWAAVLTEQLENDSTDMDKTAVDLYTQLATDYPDDLNAAEALYNAGWSAYNNEDSETAFDLWQQAAEKYPSSEFGAAAVVWLLRLLEPNADAAQRQATRLAADITAPGYAGWRARDLAAGKLPFAPRPAFVLPNKASEQAAQAEAEEWLRDWLELDVETAANQPSISDLSPELLNNEHLIVGEKLWRLGLFPAAILEFEGLRADYADDPLATYQLALFFRDLGAYRSSIGAAESLLAQAKQTVLEAPKFIGQLAYPIHYADLILPAAANYGYDPRLQFALVRQESLFESIARSGAAAQGLSQVIPETGAWIAGRLDWPDYENADLFKPYVGITFGGYYLAEQLDFFDNSVHTALSAYNGGPGNAARWYETAGNDIDWYVNTVDFPETRLYIERIYSGFDIYRYLYAVESN
ncbi:MAG: transglycosylase SLT domain-containing protein [Anaerolineales bacterium]|nr:transglycosylase SLT domain-containing protein [Anaerolineales bacterium]